MGSLGTLIKWAIIIGGDILLPPPGIPLFTLLYFGFTWIVISFKVYIYTIYLTIRLVIFILIQLPLRLGGFTTKAIGHFFHTLLGGMERFPKHAAFFFALSTGIALYLIPVSILVGSGLDILFNLFDNAFQLIILMFTASLIFFFMMAIYLYGLGKKIPEMDLPGIGQPTPQNISQTAQQAEQTAEQVHGAYKDIKKSNIAGSEGNVDLLALPSDMQHVLASALDNLPFIEAEEKGLKVSATKGKGSTISLIKFLKGLIIVYVTAGLFGFVLAIITMWGILSWGWFSGIYGPILSFLGGMFGLSVDYGNYFGTTFSNQYLAGVEPHVEGAAETYTEAKNRVFCLLKGPACLRQRRLNQTSRPGSQDVGERYGLKIDRFSIGRNRYNIRNSYAKDTIPVSFTISNPRRGLKGINAYDVSYRIQIIDASRGYRKPYCDTGWIGIDNSYDIGGDETGVQNDIYPGTSASTSFLLIDDEYVQPSPQGNGIEEEPEDIGEGLTLENCELLQPGAGVTRTAVLYLKYDYFSQATLYFDAMSLRNLRTNSDIRVQTQESRTADTPVQAAMNIQDPVVYEIQQNGGTRSVPRSVRATLNAREDDIFYRVNGMIIEGSRFMERAQDPNCVFAEPDGGEYQLNSRARAQFIEKDPDLARQQEFFTSPEPDKLWFSESNPAPVFGCRMRLKNKLVPQISETGETLTMGIRSNYTVAKRDKVGQFTALNRICGQANCPLLVTLQANHSSDYNFRATCTGLDSSEGCTVVPNMNVEDWHKNYFSTVSPVNAPGPDPLSGGTRVHSDTNIDGGEVVLDLEKLNEKSDIQGTWEGSSTYPGGGNPFPVGGVDEGDWKRVDRDLDGIPNEDDPTPLGGSGSNTGALDVTQQIQYYSIVQYIDYDTREVEVEFVRLTERECLEGDIVDDGLGIDPRPVYVQCGPVMDSSSSSGGLIGSVSGDNNEKKLKKYCEEGYNSYGAEWCEQVSECYMYSSKRCIPSGMTVKRGKVTY